MKIFRNMAPPIDCKPVYFRFSKDFYFGEYFPETAVDWSEKIALSYLEPSPFELRA
jgi:hypothetical protein